MSKNSNSITATLARGRELRAIAQQQDPRLAASEALGFLQRHRKVLGLPEVLEQPLHYVVAAFAEVERGNRAALFEPMKKGRPPDPAAKRDIRVKVALVIDLLEAADRTREQAARQVARELQLRGIAIKCRSSKGDVPEWRTVLEWRNELRRARQGWSPADIYCFQRYRYLKIVRRGKLKPETEARRLLATLRPPRSPQCALPSCGMKIAAIAISLALAALSGSRPGQDPGLQVVPEAHVWNYGDLDRTCLRWTHGCVVCDRGSLCSNIGFACTSQFASSAFTGNSGGAQFVRSGERP